MIRVICSTQEKGSDTEACATFRVETDMVSKDNYLYEPDTVSEDYLASVCNFDNKYYWLLKLHGPKKYL